MKFGIYKNEWSSAYVDAFTLHTGRLIAKDNAFFCYDEDAVLVAVYPMSAFYIVLLEK